VILIYGWLYVRDLETDATVYYRDLELDGLIRYNAVPVAASPTLIGNSILVPDNPGDDGRRGRRARVQCPGP
jgi:hypothetical protein